mgnify:CR=1 FL=1
MVAVVNDPIADMLTRIRNALMARHSEVAMPYSQMKEQLARVLQQEGYIEGYKVVDEKPCKMLRIKLKYVGTRRQRKPVISGLQRVSKPGRRVYAGYREIPWVKSGMGIAILSTPRGVMTDHRARRERVGGEILCYVW